MKRKVKYQLAGEFKQAKVQESEVGSMIAESFKYIA